MPAFRLYSQLQAFHGSDGQLLADGYLKFYEAGTTTPANVYGDKALTLNNGPTAALDGTGKLVDPVWGDTDDSYFVELYDADDVKQGEEDDVEAPGGAGQTVPVPSSGEFLTGDGVNFALEDLTARLLPDPTGQADKYLSNNGSVGTWVTGPADGNDAENVGSTTNEFHVGDMYVVTGTATGTNSGGRTQDVTVTYATPFTTAPVFVDAIPTSATLSTYGNMPSRALVASTTTGFTIRFTLGELDDTQAGYDFNANLPCKWIAIGERTS